MSLPHNQFIKRLANLAEQEFIFEIIENTGGWMLKHAAESLKANRQFVITVSYTHLTLPTKA